MVNALMYAYTHIGPVPLFSANEAVTEGAKKWQVLTDRSLGGFSKAAFDFAKINDGVSIADGIPCPFAC